MSRFSNMLRYLRLREGLTQQQMAEKISKMTSERISRSRINNYENGLREPDYETLELFADFFNVNMDTLMGRTSFNQVDTITAEEINLVTHYRQATEEEKQKARIILKL